MDYERYYLDLLDMMNSSFKKIASGKYDKKDVEKLLALSKTGRYPHIFTEMAESFSMMMIKVEARDFHLKQLKKDGKKAVVSIKGQLDTLTTPKFKKALLELIDNGERKIILDFSELDFISTAGLSGILVLVRRMKVEKGELSIAALKGQVKKVFNISGLSSCIPVFDTVAAAEAKT
jgi:anti-anti-sigma factor